MTDADFTFMVEKMIHSYVGKIRNAALDESIKRDVNQLMLRYPERYTLLVSILTNKPFEM